MFSMLNLHATQLFICFTKYAQRSTSFVALLKLINKIQLLSTCAFSISYSIRYTIRLFPIISLSENSDFFQDQKKFYLALFLFTILAFFLFQFCIRKLPDNLQLQTSLLYVVLVLNSTFFICYLFCIQEGIVIGITSIIFWYSMKNNS